MAAPYRPGDTITWEQVLINVTGNGTNQMPKADLNRLIAFFKGKGWQPNYPVTWDASEQLWWLTFTRIAQYRNGVFIGALSLSIYRWDSQGNCARRRSNGQPFAGMICQQAPL